MNTMIKGFLLALLLAAAPPRLAAQDFDYYLLALSWSPSYCLAEGNDRGAEQCEPSRDLGFTLHGLWPQYEDGWPEFCDTSAADPSRRVTGAMADIMGSGGLAWYQWEKHGRCSGLSAADYFDAARKAFSEFDLPPISGGNLSGADLEAAFLAANPNLGADDVIVTCRDNLVREVRICLDRALSPRPCAPDVLRGACRSSGALAMPDPP